MGTGVFNRESELCIFTNEYKTKKSLVKEPHTRIISHPIIFQLTLKTLMQKANNGQLLYVDHILISGNDQQRREKGRGRSNKEKQKMLTRLEHSSTKKAGKKNTSHLNR